jgi:hypothetical protein
MWGKTAEDVLSSILTWSKYLDGYTLDQIEDGIIMAANISGGHFPTPPEVSGALKLEKNKQEKLDRTFYLQLKKREEKAENYRDSPSYYSYSLTNAEKAYVEEYERRELAKVGVKV